MGNALNLQELNQEQALHLSKFFIRSGQNLFLFGRRGVGKTHIALQAAALCKFKVNYINLSVIERPDLAGYPDMNVDGDVITFKSPAFLPRLEEGVKPNTIILFDEVDKAPPEVTAPLLEILQFKRINGVPLNVAGCILTGNLANEGAYSNLISTALLDRGAKYILSFNFDLWIDWAKKNNIHDLVLGFLRSNPDLACGKLEDSCYASPSPRTWTLASEALIRAREQKIADIETVTQIISGYVGGEAGLKFKIWYEYYRRFEPYIHTLIETGSTTLNFNDLMPTEKIVFVISACYYAKQKFFGEPTKSKNRLVYLEHLCKFLQQSKVEHEVQVMGFYNSFDFEFIAKHKLHECKVFSDHFNKLTESVTFKK
jgi:hypothetical protein